MPSSGRTERASARALERWSVRHHVFRHDVFWSLIHGFKDDDGSLWLWQVPEQLCTAVIDAKVNPPPSRTHCVDASTCRRAWTLRHVATSTLRHVDVDASKRQRFDASTRRRVDASKRRRVDAAMRRRVHASTRRHVDEFMRRRNGFATAVGSLSRQ